MRDIAPLGIRLPAELKQRVADAAKISGKSMNSFVVDVLEEALPTDLSQERDLFLTRAAFHYSQSPLRYPEIYPEGNPQRAAAIEDQNIFAQYLSLKHPTIDPNQFLNEDRNFREFEGLLISEIDQKQRQIREFVAKHFMPRMR